MFQSLAHVHAGARLTHHQSANQISSDVWTRSFMIRAVSVRMTAQSMHKQNVSIGCSRSHRSCRPSLIRVAYPYFRRFYISAARSVRCDSGTRYNSLPSLPADRHSMLWHGRRHTFRTVCPSACCGQYAHLSILRVAHELITMKTAIGLFSGTVLNVRKHIFERKHRKSSRNFSSIVNK